MIAVSHRVSGSMRITAPAVPVLAISAALGIFSITGPNIMLGLFASLVLCMGTLLLWRPGEPLILLFIFLYQWVQAAVGLFYGYLLGLPIDLVPTYVGWHEMAVFLLLTGLLVLALAMRFAAGPANRVLFHRVQAFVALRTLTFWLAVFIGAWLFSAVCASLAPLIAGLRQPLLALAEIKWAAFILLTLATFAVPGRPKIVWLAVFSFQFAFSLGGFFSSFKDVFIYALIGLAASNTRFKARLILPSAVLVVALLFLGLIWTAIKGEYRVFVSEGTGQQVVLVSYPDRVDELMRLAFHLDGQDLSDAADQMARRLMYFQYFGVVLDRVPGILPHTDGAIWGRAAFLPFMPRLLFPDKSAINDSELTNRYTGLGVASYLEGTSISMGYMTEAYIDFGPLLMFVPIVALGLFIGYIHRWLLTRPHSGAVLGVALAPFALMPAFSLETSALKLVPALILSIIPCWIVLRVLGPRLFEVTREAEQLRPAVPIRRTGA